VTCDSDEGGRKGVGRGKQEEEEVKYVVSSNSLQKQNDEHILIKLMKIRKFL